MGEVEIGVRLFHIYTKQQQQLLWLVQEQGLPYRSGTLAELLGFVASL